MPSAASCFQYDLLVYWCTPAWYEHSLASSIWRGSVKTGSWIFSLSVAELIPKRNMLILGWGDWHRSHMSVSSLQGWSRDVVSLEIVLARNSPYTHTHTHRVWILTCLIMPTCRAIYKEKQRWILSEIPMKVQIKRIHWSDSVALNKSATFVDSWVTFHKKKKSTQ